MARRKRELSDEEVVAQLQEEAEKAWGPTPDSGRPGPAWPWVLAAIVVGTGIGLVIWAPAELEVSCRVAGALGGGSSCTFTNPGVVLPGKDCVRARLRKARVANALLGPGAAVGEETTSAQVCSGRVWGGSSIKVDLGYFDQEPVRFCGGADNCDMEIIH